MREERFALEQRIDQLTDENLKFGQTIQSNKIEFNEISE
jgi:hypothetical protein